MLRIVLEGSIRSTLLLVAVLLALKLLRVRNPHTQTAAWRMVLAASLLMPFLLGRATFAVMPAALPILAVGPADLAGLATQAVPQSPVDAETAGSAGIDWLAISLAVYLMVAGLLGLRLLVGCALTWRFCRSAAPVREDWTAGTDVRVNPSITLPVTFASTVLLPPGYASWDAIQRRAVLAHESAHVRRGDFFVLILSSINRAVFWFNPMAWWLHRKIADLAEAASDVAAIEDIGDRLRYAEILLEFWSRADRLVPGVAMAKAGTVGRRVERILAETTLPKKMSWRAWAVLAAAILPLAAIAAGAVVAQTSAEDPLDIVWRQLEQQRPRKEVYVEPKRLDNYVGFYQLDQFKLFEVTRRGDRLHVRLTGQVPVRVYAESPQKFFYRRVPRIGPAQLSFATDAQGHATALILHQYGRERPAKRIDEAQAKVVEEGFARRLKDPSPLPGSEAALMRQIQGYQQGRPAYHEMTEGLATATRSQTPGIARHVAALGPLQSLSFRGVGDRGYDVYEARFANGISICRIFLTEGGKVSGLVFQWGP